MGLSDLVRDLFETAGFPARWNCGTGWTKPLGWLHILSDWTIFAAYAAIPLVLALFLRRRRDIPFPSTGWLFVGFILSCGITHLVDSLMFYWPAYRLLAVMKVITAAVSLATVVSLVKIMPAVLRVPGIHRQNVELQSDLHNKEREARSLERVRDQLETKAADFTRQLARVRSAFEAAGVFAAEWEPGSDRIIWQIGAETLFASIGSGASAEWAPLLGARGARSLHDATIALRDGSAADLVVPLESDRAGRSLRIVARLQVAGTGGAPRLTGMARVLDAHPGPA